MNKAIVVGVFLSLWGIGCTPTIKVEMPDKPMEINLNVKVDHKIKIQVDKELENVMDSNEDIF
ncbi:MAG: YnbE family lipoprotein [Bdellovibrionales bacterium]|nr:YnbE family lipoprotein [Bdellovibrionales bacterium]